MAIKTTYTDLGDGIIHIDAEYINPGVASVYLIIEDEECAIVETGTNNTVPYIMSVLRDFGLDEKSVRYVIPTHVHLDHAGGVGKLIDDCPNSDLVIHPLGARHMIDPSKLIAGASAVYGEEAFNAMYGTLKPVPAERVMEAPDNFEIELGSRKIRFYDTPGHAKHHFCVHDLKSNTIFTGDTYGIGYPSLSTPSGPLVFATTTPVQFDPDALRASIQKLESLNPAALNLTHYGRITPSPEISQQLFASIDKYLEIVETHEASGDQRSQLIDTSIQDYLLSEYQRLGGELSDEDVLKLIAMDSKLNAQGLDFWVSKKSR